jgi:hypothetical protein
MAAAHAPALVRAEHMIGKICENFTLLHSSG